MCAAQAVLSSSTTTMEVMRCPCPCSLQPFVQGQLPSDAPWSCGQHPDPDMADMGCEAEQEEEDQQLLLAAASGWLGQGELPGSDRNIAHYRHLLRGWDGAGSDLYDRDSVLQWLSQRRPEELSQKVQRVPGATLD